MSAADEIVWEDPPDVVLHRHAGRGRWQIFAETLKQDPGKWAIARAGMKTPPGSLHANLKKIGLDVTGRRNDDGTYTVWARWPEDAS